MHLGRQASVVAIGMPLLHDALDFLKPRTSTLFLLLSRATKEYFWGLRTLAHTVEEREEQSACGKFESFRSARSGTSGAEMNSRTNHSYPG